MSELPLTDRLRDISVLDLSGVAVNLLVCGLTVYLSIAEPAFPAVLGLCLLVLFCFCVFLLTPPSQRLKLLCLFWLQAAAITGLFFLVYNSFVGILGIVWIVQAANLHGPGRASLLLVLNITLLFLSMVYHSGIDNVWNALISALSFALFQVFALGAMYQAINERLHREKTATLNRELLATRELLSQTSAQGERLRIARDLHDILGHHMTALILNLEVAKHKLEGDALDKVEQSLALAKLLLGDLRSTVGDLRADDRIDLQQSLRKLVQGIPNMTIELDCDQAPQINDVDKAETLLRCAQEGLTNVLRHSDAQHCRISLGEEAGRSLLIVEDDGKAKAADIKPGNGLKGMQERLQAAGGALAWTHSGGGFQLRAELPLE